MTQVRSHATGRDHVIPRQLVVLATGGFASGALALDSDWQARETVLGLQLAGVPAAGEPRCCATTSPSSRSPAPGVAVDADAGREGYRERARRRRFAAGREPWRRGPATGSRLASGHLVAQSIAGREERATRMSGLTRCTS